MSRLYALHSDQAELIFDFQKNYPTQFWTSILNEVTVGRTDLTSLFSFYELNLILTEFRIITNYYQESLLLQHAAALYTYFYPQKTVFKDIQYTLLDEFPLLYLQLTRGASSGFDICLTADKTIFKEDILRSNTFLKRTHCIDSFPCSDMARG